MAKTMKAKAHGSTRVFEVAEDFDARTSGRRIRRPEFVEIAIEGRDDKILGRLRVEPNRIMWGDKETKKWRRVPLERFIEWINDPKKVMSSGSELVEK
jgi:hypothetical protein